MATVAGVKIKTKAPKTRNPLFMDEKYTGEEYQWPADAADWPDDKFDSKLRRSLNYYNYFYTTKECKKYVVDWMKTSGNFTKEEAKAFDRSTDRCMPMTAYALIMAHRAGMPLKQKYVDFISKFINDAIDKAEPEPVTVTTEGKVEAYKPTIQDRLSEKTSELIGELEGKYDDMETVKFYDWLTSNNVVQSQLGKYEGLFSKRRDELELAQAKKDDQLKEGYSHYKPADFKKRIAWLTDLLSAIEQYRGVKQATKKARVKKAPSKEKVVSKLKYAKEDKGLKVVSINPADIVGASELWIYNIKTRKLGKYVAASYHTLAVKGTSITGFDEDKSVSKTLRKPDEQLKEFAKAGKIALRTFIKDIKAVETKLNGRISTDILLLKVA